MLGRKFGLSIASLPIDRGGNDLVYVEKKVVNMQAMHSCWQKGTNHVGRAYKIYFYLESLTYFF